MERGRPDSGPGLRATRRILWASFLFSLVVYGALGYTVLAGASDAAGSPVPGWIWPAVAGALAAAALILPRALGNQLSRRAGSASLASPSELVGWAFAEAVGIIGLVSVILGGVKEYLVLYLLAAAAILWIRRPTARGTAGPPRERE